MFGKWCSCRLARPNNGGRRGKGKGNGRPPGNAASPPSRADAVVCSWAFLLSSARLVVRGRSPEPGLQHPQREPGHPVGDQESISCMLLGRWSLVVHSEGVADVSDVGVVLMILLLKSGGENCVRCGEKNRDVGGSTGLNPAEGVLKLAVLKQERKKLKNRTQEEEQNKENSQKYELVKRLIV